MRRALLLFVACALLTTAPAAARVQQTRAPAAAQASTDGIARLLAKLQSALASGSPASYFPLITPTADRPRAEGFALGSIRPGALRAVVVERDRRPHPNVRTGEAFVLMVEVFVEAPAAARIATWGLDVRRAGTGPDGETWLIENQEPLTSVEGLHRLTLNREKQFRARNLKVNAEDLELRLADGVVYQAETPEGVTALLLMGSGEIDFHPTPETERGQVRIATGQDRLVTRFSAALVRMHPIEYDDRTSLDALVPEPVDARKLRAAEEIFQQEVTKSYGIDLSDISQSTWSLVPPMGDFLAEVRTKRFGTLTYTRSRSEPEDITLFNRAQHRNLSVYASKDKLSRRGRFYDEDDFTEYDILDYNIAAFFDPDRSVMDGVARLRLRVRAQAFSTFTMRLAESLNIESISSDVLGHVLHLRVRNQNTVIINLPATITKGTVLDFTIRYSGPMRPQTFEREAVAVSGDVQQPPGADVIVLPPEPSYIYSNRSYWYPQAGVTDYATATLHIGVPAAYECVASGELAAPPVVEPGTARAGDRKKYTFNAQQPLRYLAVLVSRLVPVTAQTVTMDSVAQHSDTRGGPSAEHDAQGVFYKSVDYRLLTHPRLTDRGREVAARAPDIIRFYASLVGDIPYPGISLAIVENELPGGHSPAYLAAINQPSPFSPMVWRNDPATFQNYPEFYVAHEIAHQWWGQAIGWKNYHEQWLSEGFAQYFAALYARQLRGPAIFDSVMSRLRRFAMNASDQGPVYLGYRLGHIKGDSRIFRSLVYNKGAVVLHMLRRLIGDETFGRGLRRFYTTWRFKKAGSDDVRRAFEEEAGRSLERFFERWIYGSALPQLRFSYRTDSPSEIVVRFEQTGEVFDVPVTVKLIYADGHTQETVIPVTDSVVEQRVPLTGTLRRVEVNDDNAALAEIKR